MGVSDSNAGRTPMNRQQRRYAARQATRRMADPNEQLEVDRVVVYFRDGRQSTLDMTKVAIIQKDTGLSLFDIQESGVTDEAVQE
jgi:hypothetical protein